MRPEPRSESTPKGLLVRGYSDATQGGAAKENEGAEGLNALRDRRKHGQRNRQDRVTLNATFNGFLCGECFGILELQGAACTTRPS